jgi:SAM-dependent methyltransferase
MTPSKSVAPASDHWSSYWARGALTSLPDDFRANYDGEIAAFWQNSFEALPPDAAILDVCTGNGALALLAAEFSKRHGRAFDITALDAARIDPAAAVENLPDLKELLESIHFVDQTPLERFQPAPASLDLVTSQYGIEYCDQSLAAQRVAEWLKPAGQLVMLCHALSSDMLKTMQVEQRDYQRLDELRLLRTLKAWLGKQLDSVELRRRFGRAGRELMPVYQRSRSPLLAFALGMIEQVVQWDESNLRARHDQLAAAHAQLQGGSDRLADMLRVNRMMDDPRWFEVYIEAGLELTDQGALQYRGQHHVGHFFRFRR